MNAIEFTVKQILKPPTPSLRQPGRPPQADQVRIHNRILDALIAKHGFVTSVNLAEDQKIRLDDAYVVLSAACRRGFLVYAGKVDKRKTYVRA